MPALLALLKDRLARHRVVKLNGLSRRLEPRGSTQPVGLVEPHWFGCERALGGCDLGFNHLVLGLPDRRVECPFEEGCQLLEYRPSSAR